MCDLGVGPGNGAAIGARFAEDGYAVALCARNKEKLNKITAKIHGSRTFQFDVKDTETTSEVFAEIRSSWAQWKF